MTEKLQFGNLPEGGKKKIDEFMEGHKRFMDADDTNPPRDIFRGKHAIDVQKFLTKDTYEEFQNKVNKIQKDIEELKHKSIVASADQVKEIDLEMHILELQLKRVLRWLNDMEKEEPNVAQKDPAVQEFQKKLKGQKAELN